MKKRGSIIFIIVGILFFIYGVFGEEFVIEGYLKIEHVDDFNEGKSSLFYTLVAEDVEYILEFSETPFELESGQYIRVKGVLDGVKIRVQSTEILSGSGGGVKDSLGEQKVGIVIVSFEDLPFQFPFRDNSNREIDENKFWEILNDVSAYYEEASYGKMTFSFEIVGTYQLGKASSYLSCDSIASAVRTIANKDGADERRNYERLMYIFPYTDKCLPKGSIGKVSDSVWSSGLVFSHTFISTWSFSRYSIGHELGHNLRLLHADSLDCGLSSIVQDLKECKTEEYGDEFDIMGRSDMHLNAYHKEQLGWFDTGNVLELSEEGNYFLRPLALPTSDLQVLKIPRESQYSWGRWYYLEYRYPFGYDDSSKFIQYNQPGLLLHIYYPQGRADSQLVDFSPEDSPEHAVLASKEIYYDSIGKFTLSVISADQEGAKIHIDRNPVLFQRGEVNNDHRVDLSDAIFILNFLFNSGNEPSCLDATDINDDGVVDLSDAIFLLQYLFIGGKEIPKPSFQEGIDTSFDALDCKGKA